MSAVEIAVKRPTRIVSKAFDGDAAINALLMRKLNGADFAKMLDLAQGLLSRGVCRSDVQMVCGIPQKIIAAAARHVTPSQRLGRRPLQIGALFESPDKHLRVSIFLSVIERLIPELPEGKAPLTGEVLLAALEHTEMVCGVLADKQTTSRYYLTCVHKLSQGHVYLKNCGICGVRYLKTRRAVQLHSSGTALIGGECPYCKYLNWLKRGARRRKSAVATTETEGLTPQGKGCLNQASTITESGAGSRCAEPRDMGTASFEAIMRSV